MNTRSGSASNVPAGVSTFVQLPTLTERLIWPACFVVSLKLWHQRFQRSHGDIGNSYIVIGGVKRRVSLSNTAPAAMTPGVVHSSVRGPRAEVPVSVTR